MAADALHSFLGIWPFGNHQQVLLSLHGPIAPPQVDKILLYYMSGMIIASDDGNSIACQNHISCSIHAFFKLIKVGLDMPDHDHLIIIIRS